MRVINTIEIETAVEKLFVKANYFLPESLCKCITDSKRGETSELALSVLEKIEEMVYNN